MFLKTRLLYKILIIGFFFLIFVFALNYLFLSKIHNEIFKLQHSDFAVFKNQNNEKEIEYRGVKVKFHIFETNPAEDYIFYIPSRFGSLNNIVNSSFSRYNLIILEYPVEKKLQNFKDLRNIAESILKFSFSKETDFKKVLLLGHEIGGNIALSLASKFDFKSVLILNPTQNERNYCKIEYHSIFCLAIRPSFPSFYNLKSPVYYFFNNQSKDLNYEIFNLIDAPEKFILEIPGDNLNFNANHILEFYLNEDLIQSQNFENINESDENYEGEIRDVDGLINPDDYVD